MIQSNNSDDEKEKVVKGIVQRLRNQGQLILKSILAFEADKISLTTHLNNLKSYMNEALDVGNLENLDITEEAVSEFTPKLDWEEEHIILLDALELLIRGIDVFNSQIESIYYSDMLALNDLIKRQHELLKTFLLFDNLS